MKLRDFAVAVFTRELADPGQAMIPSPIYLSHLFEVLEEEIAKHVKAQQDAQVAAAKTCDTQRLPVLRVDESTGETLGEVEHPTPAG